MLLELGPYPADEAARWTKFARRVLLEIQSNSSLVKQISDDVVTLWRMYINDWATEAERQAKAGQPFRWQVELESDVAEFLLHALDQCWHSVELGDRLTAGDVQLNHGFTMHIVRAFVDGLADQGDGCHHYIDQVVASFGGSLE